VLADFLIKSGGNTHPRRLAVPTQKEEAVQILYFVGKEGADRLDALQPTVDIIAKTEITGLG
jgi:hypothetical protein